MHRPLLHLPGHDRPPTRDREHILDRHQERLVQIPLRLRDVLIHRVHQLHDLGLPLRITLERLQRRHPDHRQIITREVVVRQQLPHLELHQLQQLLIIHRVGLVQRHHDVRHPHLTGQQHMLTGLGHRTIRRRHHQNRPIHLRRPGDHVLDVIGMPRHIHMRVMALVRLVLHMRDRDRDPPRLLLRRLINLIERRKRHIRVLLRQRLGNRRRQRRLPVIDVTHRPHVHVRLVPLELRLAHRDALSLLFVTG